DIDRQETGGPSASGPASSGPATSGHPVPGDPDAATTSTSTAGSAPSANASAGTAAQAVGTAAGAATGAGAAAAPAASGPPAHVGAAHQVLPEMARLASRGDGVHQVTLQLNPRALGDVRVVLTLRQGDVHVRLAAGPEARAALARSSSELSRALDRLGLGDHRISLSGTGAQDASVVVARGGAHDPSTRTGQDDASPADHPNDPRTDPQTRQDTDPSRSGHAGGTAHQQRQQDHHSWTGDSTTARDGLTDGPGARPRGGRARITTTDRPGLPGTVDLRM
ncbi:MAG: flagellar hook-length control protein FliK, partial [Marmoricola sp.]|nr:flagellar hook-length control protein FliK [Marmoricola sp.]